MANHRPFSQRRPGNRIVQPNGAPMPQARPPIPQIVGVETADDPPRKLTLRVGALAACESPAPDEDEGTCHICVGGSWVHIKAHFDAIIQLMTGNFVPRTPPEETPETEEGSSDDAPSDTRAAEAEAEAAN